jgi:hypothetical protein
MLYLHGGGYIGTSPNMYTLFAARLARATRCEIFVADYRLAPEFPYPAALHDALDVLAAHVAMHKAVLELALRDVEMGVVELDQIRHVLTLEARKKTAKELAAQGLSTRQIAAVTGTSQRTIARDIAEPDGSKSEPSGSKSVPGGAPEEPSADIDPDAKAEITDLANKFREQTATHTNRLAQAQKDFHRAARRLALQSSLCREERVALARGKRAGIPGADFGEANVGTVLDVVASAADRGGRWRLGDRRRFPSRTRRRSRFRRRARERRRPRGR